MVGTLDDLTAARITRPAGRRIMTVLSQWPEGRRLAGLRLGGFGLETPTGRIIGGGKDVNATLAQ